MLNLYCRNQDIFFQIWQNLVQNSFDDSAIRTQKSFAWALAIRSVRTIPESSVSSMCLLQNLKYLPLGQVLEATDCIKAWAQDNESFRL